jgi:LytS/YehU family sensor histidine kinase
MIKKLSGLLHYIINECQQSLVPLEKELKMIQDYISLETIRYDEQFDITVDIKGNYRDKNIAPLLLLPFIENSFKHGSSKTLSKPWVNLNIIFENTKMYFMLNNSRPQEYINPNCNGGIGLSNVQKRLQLLYPERHELTMTSEPEHFTVLLEIDLEPVNKELILKKNKKKILQYEMA